MVNPPSNAGSVFIRFVNLAGDKKPRTFVMNGEYETAPVEYSRTSTAVNPPSDSIKAIVRIDGVDDYADTLVYRFSRNLTYSFVGLPSVDEDSTRGPLTSFAVLTTSSVIKKDSKNAYVKVLNAVPDKDTSYSIRFGCPNGKAITQNLFYRKYSPMTPIQSGVIAVSLTKRVDSADIILGLYEFDLQQRGQYTFIIRDGDSGEELWVLDELDHTTGAFSEATSISAESKITEIRAINFSQSDVKLVKQPDVDIGQPLPPERIGNYEGIGACQSEDADIITAFAGPGFADSASSASSSLVVLEKYTVLVFDSAETTANRMVLIEPDREYYPDRVKIRVVHQAENLGGLTFTVGARMDTNRLNFRSGEIIAAALTYGEVSAPSFIYSDSLRFYAPITIFASTQPAKYVTSAPAYLETGKSYLLVITNSGNETRITLIEEDDVDGEIDYLDEGVFVEVVHALPGPVSDNTVSVDIVDVVSQAVVYYASSLATVVTQGAHTIEIAGKTVSFDAELGKRNLFILCGEADNPEILQFSSDPMNPGDNDYKRRFINATSENPFISVRFNTAIKNPDIADIIIQFGQASEAFTVTRENKISLYFFNPEISDTDFISQVNDLSFNFRKSYSIIFAGSEKYGGYSIIVQQEF